jgi:tetratricopeptide (TPR) repeat protein
MKHGRSMVQVLGIYAAASWVVLQIVDVLKQNMGLPDWVFPFALVLLLLGLPVILTTLVVQRKILTAATAGGSQGGAEPDSPRSPADHAVVRRLFSWRNAIMGGVLAFSLLFGFAGLGVLLKEKVLSPDDAIAESAVPAIAILPFTVRGDGLELWREGMVDLMSTNLDGAAGLRTIAGRTVLARWNETDAAETGGDLETALEVARATGAAYALLGSAVSSGSGMRLTADLYDVRTGESLGDVQIEGPADSVFTLVDRLSVATVRELAATEGADAVAVDLAGVTTSSVEALKSYLEGMTYFRRSDFETAVESFSRAIDADSTFALAYLRLANCYGWMEGVWSGLQAEANEMAVRYKDQLPRRERILVEADLSVTGDDVVGLEDLKEYVQVHPDDAEAWFILGELYIHRGASFPVTRDEMERVFARAVELDPSFGPYHSHLVDVAMWTTPDSAYIAGLMEAAEQASGGAADRALLMDLAFGDEAHRAGALERLETGSVNEMTDLLLALRHPRYWDSLEPAMRAYYGRAEDAGISGVSPDQVRGASAFIGATGAAQAGQGAKALDFLELDSSQRFRTCLITEMHNLGMSVLSDVLQDMREIDPADDVRPPTLVCLAILAVDEDRQVDLEALTSALDDLRRQAVEDGESERTETLSGLLEFTEGYRLWRAGDPARALPLLVDNFRSVGGPFGRLWIGQIYMELGQPAEAVNWLNTMWGRQYLPTAYLELGRAYEALGEMDQAVAAYAEFVEAWATADPELQPRVEAARTRLEEIVRERG